MTMPLDDGHTILLVCDDDRRAALVRSALTPSFVVRVTATSDADDLRAPHVDVVLVDLGASTAGGPQVVRARQQWERPVVAIVAEPTERLVVPPLAAGARGLLVWATLPDGLDHAVRAALAGALYVDPAAAGVLVTLARLNARAERLEGLTPAQLRVLVRFPQGRTNHEIAAELGISVNTVKTHVRHILAALGCDNRVEAARAARRLGLIP